MEWRVPLADLDYGAEEEQAVLEVIRSRWLTMGAVTQAFEKAFAEFVGARHALAVSNGTVALHLACRALELTPDDEVIVPALTFVATVNAVRYTGAQARFADIVGLDELTIAPQEIERQITPRTRAIVVMHYGGYPCRMAEIMRIAEKHNLVVIEDAAHAPGGRLDGKALGVWGEIGCFSFFSNKNLSTGEGGMLVTNRDDLAEKVRLLRSHGMTTLTWDRHKGHAYTYDVVDLGYNYRIDEIRAALGLVQLKKLERNNRKRQEITEAYWQNLAGLGLGMPFRQAPGEPAYHIFPALLPEGIDRRQFMEHMQRQGVQTSIHYPPVHLFQYYRSRYPGVSLPNTEAAGGREVTLPLYPGMHPAAIQIVVSAVQRSLEALRA